MSDTALPETETIQGAPPATTRKEEPSMFGEYLAKSFVVLIAAALGLLVACIIGLVTGWIPFSVC
jgi:hypothetical protein